MKHTKYFSEISFYILLANSLGKLKHLSPKRERLTQYFYIETAPRCDWCLFILCNIWPYFCCNYRTLLQLTSRMNLNINVTLKKANYTLNIFNIEETQTRKAKDRNSQKLERRAEPWSILPLRLAMFLYWIVDFQNKMHSYFIPKHRWYSLILGDWIRVPSYGCACLVLVDSGYHFSDSKQQMRGTGHHKPHKWRFLSTFQYYD